MLTSGGAKLLDFGLAKLAAPLASLATLTATKRESPVTEQGTIVGTFQYMSPEQVEGKELDGRSDIFSLGSVLYEMLTGKKAFEGKSQLSVASAILEKERVSISTLKPMTPPALKHAIRRCLAKDPEDRWQTARDLALELRWISEGGPQPGATAGSREQGKRSQSVAWGVATSRKSRRRPSPRYPSCRRTQVRAGRRACVLRSGRPNPTGPGRAESHSSPGQFPVGRGPGRSLHRRFARSPPRANRRTPQVIVNDLSDIFPKTFPASTTGRSCRSGLSGRAGSNRSRQDAGCRDRRTMRPRPSGGRRGP
jgi:serine/threonine protein kinase